MADPRALAPKAGDCPEAGPAVDGAPAIVPKPLRLIFASYAKQAELAPSTVKRWTPMV
jgi:integrase